MEPSEKSSLINESVEYVYLLSYILASKHLAPWISPHLIEEILIPTFYIPLIQSNNSLSFIFLDMFLGGLVPPLYVAG